MTDPRYAARGWPPDSRAPIGPYGEHDACGTGFIAHRDGVASQRVVALALEAVSRMAHRGASASDTSGDGAGLLTQLPQAFFARVAGEAGLRVPDGPLAVMMCFVPPDAAAAASAEALATSVCADDGIPVLGWRTVPVNPDALGPAARAAMPGIRQLILGRPADCTDDDAWERALYLARRAIEQRAEAQGLALYVCSSSCRTIVYKALLNGPHLGAFYPDLAAPDFASAIAVFHERYATNVLPRWELAQPFRLLAHNGEINTLWGNRNAMAMRAPLLTAPMFGARGDRVMHPMQRGGSDSTSLDNTLELLVRAGRSPVHAAMMCIPRAWERFPDIEPAVKAFYEYHQCLIEPWDGPAAIAYTDGQIAAVSLDRNGLRPCRYVIRDDGMVAAGSEVGIVDFDPAQVVETGKVAQGGVFVVDTVRRRVIKNLEAKREIATRKPYARWIAGHMATLPPSTHPEPLVVGSDALRAPQTALGYGHEDVRMILETMAATGADPVWSMGDDTAPPPLGRHAPTVYGFLRQRFAQVTNPPLDSLRESLGMSLRMHLGRRGSPLLEQPTAARMLRVEHPVLLPDEMAALVDFPGYPAVTLDATWPAREGAVGLVRALDALCDKAERAVRRGKRLLIVSDRKLGPTRVPVPMVLAIGAVRKHLVSMGLRAQVGLVAEAGDAVDPHDVACLIGYGAEAVHPWMAFETAASLFAEAPTHGARDHDGARPTPAEAQARVRSALEKGLLKILAKMGISTLSSYCGAQVFDALGLGAEVVDKCFPGTVSLVGGVGLDDLAQDALDRHASAWPARSRRAVVAEVTPLPDHGRVRYRKDGEPHVWAPPVVMALQDAVGAGRAAKRGTGADASRWDAFLELDAERPPMALRDLLDVAPQRAIAIDEVEQASDIAARFISSAMSLGALSPEAHETLTLAMNRIGARSNSGEGGEDPALYGAPRDGIRADSRIKQVASARFGVTAQYLVHADELEIKIVQGAKPGEGGQLPGFKVTELIARLRHSVPGVTLISPPPHHDIYSIEDLAQLVHDLKRVNPNARVGVKLVSAAGVGTVAAGVAKAFADYVLIAGHSGGTGASPLSSIKHAGAPWEIGLAEAHHVLVAQGLRERVELRVDGGLRTGRDVIVAALLGAEAYGFGTAALVAVGCLMARQCHLNTCPTGVATQDEALRKKFTGTPEQAAAYFTYVANDVRRLLATMGARRLDDLVGRADLLVPAATAQAGRASRLDLTMLRTPASSPPQRWRRVPNARHGIEHLDARLLDDARTAIAEGTSFTGTYEIRNHHLSVGARVAGAIAERHGNTGLAPDTLDVRFAGTAGQSFGAFAVQGMTLRLEGQANDYVGKGLSGGTLVLTPFPNARYREQGHRMMLLGNTALYGATGGRLFAAGQAGDRFAVRNSGAVAVVEGTGNHCCEYMTGGIVVVLGRSGRNFGAGMSNGVAYVLDEDSTFPGRVNHDLVFLAPLDEDDVVAVHTLVEEHRARTDSVRAADVLTRWDAWLPRWRKVVPRGR